MGDPGILRCARCGSLEAIYVLDGKPCCSSCYSKSRPPLAYRGPERRHRQVPTAFRRRSSDFRSKKP